MPGDSEVEMFPRLCHLGDAEEAAIPRAAALGFSGIILDGVATARNGKMQAIAEACAAFRLDVFFDIDFAEWDLHDELVEQHPDCFAIGREFDGGVVDPRSPRRG